MNGLESFVLFITFAGMLILANLQILTLWLFALNNLTCDSYIQYNFLHGDPVFSSFMKHCGLNINNQSNNSKILIWGFYSTTLGLMKVSSFCSVSSCFIWSHSTFVCFTFLNWMSQQQKWNPFNLPFWSLCLKWIKESNKISFQTFNFPGLQALSLSLRNEGGFKPSVTSCETFPSALTADCSTSFFLHRRKRNF